MEDFKNKLTNEVLLKAIKNEYDVSNELDIEICSCELNTLSETIDNFGGELKMLNCTFYIRNQTQQKEHSYKLKERSYIVKSLPLNPIVKGMLEEVIFILLENVCTCFF